MTTFDNKWLALRKSQERLQPVPGWKEGSKTTFKHAHSAMIWQTIDIGLRLINANSIPSLFHQEELLVVLSAKLCFNGLTTQDSLKSAQNGCCCMKTLPRGDKDREQATLPQLWMLLNSFWLDGETARAFLLWSKKSVSIGNVFISRQRNKNMVSNVGLSNAFVNSCAGTKSKHASRAVVHLD